MAKAKIAVIPGDGIGPEVMEQGVRVLRAVESRFGHEFSLEYGIIGGRAIDECGTAQFYACEGRGHVKCFVHLCLAVAY